MFRKSAIALGTAALIGAAALAPTAASAHSHHHHFHGGYGYGLGLVGAAILAPAVVEASSCYYVKQKVPTGFGGWTWQYVQVC